MHSCIIWPICHLICYESIYSRKPSCYLICCCLWLFFISSIMSLHSTSLSPNHFVKDGNHQLNLISYVTVDRPVAGLDLPSNSGEHIFELWFWPLIAHITNVFAVKRPMVLKTPICCERFNKTVRACAGTLFVSSCELICLNLTKSSVISQKDQSQNGCFKKTKRTKFSEKRTLLAPWYAHVRMFAYQGVGNVRFSENLACFAFLKHPFWDLPFCLI